MTRLQHAVLGLAALATAALVAIVTAPPPAQARTIVDSAGRSVEVPDTVTRVFAAGPPASILVYALKPDALLGWPRAIRGEERPYIAPAYRDLPETGRLTGRGGEANLERVLALKPDLIIDFGSVRDTYVDLANRVQEQTGIPYILVNGRFEETADSLRLVGQALGVAERGEMLARDVEVTFAELDAILADVPQESRPRVYLARGPDGLETGMKGSINTEIIERAGGRNVAEAPGQYGLVRASPEQVILANPDTIITWDRNFHRAVWSDPLWAGIEAVQRKRVYLSPTAPFGWIDRPPSLNRMMGLKWLAGLFYPQRWQGELREEARAFYRLWYHVDLSKGELDGLLEWASGRAP
ncbi:iron ABC transporter substrate-binding protein [Stappia sp. MMSF_3263]|uniref:iron ABC transporter substrate-binding protein n=1 Tax=Stappia sp. MMSF_3263 TaxID=3046693 RepID=UPI00273D2755|nr:iron ABC transporter substrate-binding protein [Stappia sp. MMSF_3263]